MALVVWKKNSEAGSNVQLQCWHSRVIDFPAMVKTAARRSVSYEVDNRRGKSQRLGYWWLTGMEEDDGLPERWC
jgi:hypothetical protein